MWNKTAAGEDTPNLGDSVDVALPPPPPILDPRQKTSQVEIVLDTSQDGDDDEDHHRDNALSATTHRPSVASEASSTRGKWSGKFEFTLTCLGYAVGLGNVWRFPKEVFDNGGGTFFIPYLMMLFFCGIPLFFLETTHGQFSGQGVASCWGYAPLFKGVGFCMMVIVAMTLTYYNVLVAWALDFLFNSFTDTLPWEECDYDSWATPKCKAILFDASCCDRVCSDCNSAWMSNDTDGTCYTTDANGSHRTVANFRRVSQPRRDFPASQYLNNHVLGITGHSVENFGGIKLELLGFLFLAWLFVTLCVSKGIKTVGKVAYVTATMPYVILAILLTFALIQHPRGSWEGIQFYLKPDLSKLGGAEVWRRAAVQIFFSLSCAQGGHITLSSYCELHHNIMRDVLIVGIGNSLTSIFAGFVIFSYLGILAEEECVEVESVAAGGPGLAFVVYPTAVTYLPAPPLWSCLFFFMLLNLGVNSMSVWVETIVTGVKDVFPIARRHKTPVAVGVCGVFFLLSVPQVFEGGKDLLDLVDGYSSGFNSLIVGPVYIASVFYVYGWRRYVSDVEFMIGSTQRHCCIPWRFWRMYWTATLGFTAPALLAFILMFQLIELERPKALLGLPAYLDILPVGMSIVGLVCILVPMVLQIVRAEGDLMTRMRTLTSATEQWGPRSRRYRAQWKEFCHNKAIGRPINEPCQVRQDEEEDIEMLDDALEG